MEIGQEGVLIKEPVIQCRELRFVLCDDSMGGMGVGGRTKRERIYVYI